MLQAISPFNTQSQLLMTPWKKAFENIDGKGENAGNHNVFYPMKDKFHVLIIFLSSARLGAFTYDNFESNLYQSTKF